MACVAASTSELPAVESESQRAETVMVAATAAANHDDSTGHRATTTAAPLKDVSILKQINKVNDDGSYTFGYEASDGSFKVETRDVAGNVKGMFGFVDDVGQLKRVSYSANNSSGFQTAGSESASLQDSTAGSPTSTQTIPGRGNKKDDGGDESDGKSSAAVKKVLVSKRPVTVTAPPTSAMADDRRRRGGNDLRRQLPRNDDGDAPDVYGVHGRSNLQESGPVSPVVSALMSELQMPVVRSSYGRPTRPPPPPVGRDDNAAVLGSRRRAAQDEGDDDTPQQYDDRPAVPVQYAGRRPPAALYQPRVVYPAYLQQQQQVAYPVQPQPPRGPLNLVALRDELMELILSFVQARVSQIVSVTPYPAAIPYPMPYQQPNYYVPSYYQGPRMPGTNAVQEQETSPTPIVTQTLKDGLIRMLLSTSPRYDPDRNGERPTTRLVYRSTTQPTPVRSVQIISGGGEDDDRGVGSRPVTTETPD